MAIEKNLPYDPNVICECWHHVDSHTDADNACSICACKPFKFQSPYFIRNLHAEAKRRQSNTGESDE